MFVNYEFYKKKVQAHRHSANTLDLASVASLAQAVSQAHHLKLRQVHKPLVKVDSQGASAVSLEDRYQDRVHMQVHHHKPSNSLVLALV